MLSKISFRFTFNEKDYGVSIDTNDKDIDQVIESLIPLLMKHMIETIAELRRRKNA